jgi:hypothetical protein
MEKLRESSNRLPLYSCWMPPSGGKLAPTSPNRQKPLLTRFPESSLAGCSAVPKLLRCKH